ncbi:MAG: O-antigen ligase domain-containing protein [Phycisphaerales bacterium]|nr:O-antigen ligase domain-containing protein [Phycisphaerales bacterium]
MSFHPSVLRWGALAVILLIAVLRTAFVILPIPIFDVDPARDPTPGIGIGPAASLFLDALLLFASGLALVAEARAGRRLSQWCVLLAVVPAVSVIYWATQDAADAFRGFTWLAAACAFVALAHLVRERAMRIVAISVLISASAPLIVRGMEQAFVEHAATVSQFESTKSQVLAERGWEPDSSAARTYTRRLMQREATGWFGLSNPYSSVMATASVVLCALAVSAWRSRRRDSDASESIASGIALTVSLCALLALLMLGLNFGKGAIAALLLGCAVVLWSGWKARAPQPKFVVVLACFAFLAMLARATLGENFGETSLYLRSLYLDGALRAFAHMPMFGVAPDGLQSAFMQLKPSNCPEDIQSAHSVFVDWIVLLGPLGMAWAAMLAISMRGAFTESAGEALDAAEISSRAVRVAFGIVIVGLVAQAFIEAPILDTFSLSLRAAGWMLFVGLAACCAFVLAAAPSRVLGIVAVAGAVVVLAHAQIEMTFFLPGSVVWMTAMLACATTLALPDAKSAECAHESSIRQQLLASVPALLAVCALYFALQERQVEQRLERAAEVVRPLADVRAAWSALSKSLAQGKATEAEVDQLVHAVRAASIDATHLRAVESALASRSMQAVAATIVQLDIALRKQAAQELLSDAGIFGDRAEWNRLPREAAVKQLAASGRRALGVKTAAYDADSLEGAIQLTHSKQSSRANLRLLFMRCDLELEQLQFARQQSASAEVTQVKAQSMLEDFTQAAHAAPHSPMRWILLGDLQEIAGFDEDARASWRRACEVNAALHLDPLAQLPIATLTMIQAKCAAKTTAPMPS